MTDDRPSPRLSRRRFTAGALSSLAALSAARGGRAESAKSETVLIAGGVPVMRILLPAGAPASVSFAALELASHVEKATGKRPAMLDEDPRSSDSLAGAVILGNSKAAAAAGMRAPDELEACAIRTVDGALLIVGHDEPGA